VGEVSVLTNVVRSVVENVSSPTLLMRHVMRLVRDVVVRQVVVEVVFAVPATPDMPLIPVTSNAMTARTEIFFRSIIVFSSECACGLKYMECSSQQYFRDSTISRTDIFEK